MADTDDLKIFFVYAPYQKVADIQARRTKVRPDHLAHMKTLIDGKILRVGGVLSDPEKVDGDALGSTMVLKYKSVEEVKKMLESDAYWKGEVWDKDNLVIRGYTPAVPVP